ncbi:hypothetical protein ACVW1C_005109 [Bradyrhizobium sp. USDA 4011]
MVFNDRDTIDQVPDEADHEAEIHGVIRKALPWLPAAAIRHQTKLSFKFGHTAIEVDGEKDFQAEGGQIFWSAGMKLPLRSWSSSAKAARSPRPMSSRGCPMQV